MQVCELNTKESTNKWWSVVDAARRSYNESTHYAEKQKVQAERMKYALELVYSNKGIHINFRKKFITIKVDNAKVKDRTVLSQLEADWDKQGIVKLQSPQGIVYRVMKVS